MTTAAISGAQWRQMALITAGAIGLYATFRVLPTGTNLNHVDFRVEGSNTLEFCDPANPQFIPVVAVRSPVETALSSSSDPVTGRETTFTLRLSTASGKPIAPPDLLIAHTRKLHLMVVDPTLRDYHHIHPEPGPNPGEWIFQATPRLSGEYRVFADFTPAATARGLYASAAFDVPGEVAVDPKILSWEAETDGYRFALSPAKPVRAREQADLTFTVRRADGGRVPMEPVMDAFAHLVAFDANREGFAHLHPNEIDLSVPPDPIQPKLTFKVTIPQAGLYVIWAQVNLDGREVYVPFWFQVEP